MTDSDPTTGLTEDVPVRSSRPRWTRRRTTLMGISPFLIPILVFASIRPLMEQPSLLSIITQSKTIVPIPLTKQQDVVFNVREEEDDEMNEIDIVKNMTGLSTIDDEITTLTNGSTTITTSLVTNPTVVSRDVNSDTTTTDVVVINDNDDDDTNMNQRDYDESTKVMKQRQQKSSSSSSSSSNTNDTDTVHVLYGLSGNHKDFLAEFETSLKSVLLNAPLDFNLHVHILADGNAYSALTTIFRTTQLHGSVWRTAIVITTYNVDRYVPRWKKQVASLYGKKIGRVTRHTIGAYFRLFANDVLSTTTTTTTTNANANVSNFIYMDTDVVIMANLADLWTRIDRDATFSWGRDHCSGFVVFNVDKLPTIWQIATTEFDFSKYTSGDQFILKQVGKLHPEIVSYLPQEWAVSVGNNGLWRHAKSITTYRPRVGMFHFNGQGAKKISYFRNKNGFIHKHSTTFGTALYYVNLPWTWTRFYGESLTAGVDKHRLVVNHKATKRTKANNKKKTVPVDVKLNTKRETVDA